MKILVKNFLRFGIALAAIILFVNFAGLTIAASAQTNTYVATYNTTASPNSYAYYDLSGVSNYTIQSGDYLQYDIQWTSNMDLIGFDYTCTDGTTLRDSSSLDQNGYNAHPAVNISAKAYNSWYSRKIAIPAGQAGKSIAYYDIACEYDGSGTRTGYIKNIRITDVNNVIRKVILVGNEASLSTAPHLVNQGSLVSFMRNVTAGPPAKVAFLTQPSAANTLGVSFGTQPVVAVQDAVGNTVTTSNAAVTLAITSGTGTSGATLSGTTTVNAVNGVANFNGLSVNLAGTGYTLTASSTGLTSAVSSTFNVSPVSTGPTLSSPVNGANLATNPVVFTWSAVSGTLYYEIQVASHSDFSGLYHNDWVVPTTFTYSDLPGNGSTIYWRVRANNGAWGSWSSTRSFTNGSPLSAPPAAPSPISPVNGVTAFDTAVNFVWKYSPGATGYWLKVIKVSDNSVLVDKNVGNVTTSTQTGFPSNGTQYKWVVAAGNSAGWTYSTWQTFNSGTTLSPPSAPNLTFPSSGATVNGTSINFQWTASSGATGYWLKVIKVSDNSVLVNKTVGNVTAFTQTGFPNDGTQYKWEVAAGNAIGWTASNWQTFTSGTNSP